MVYWRKEERGHHFAVFADTLKVFYVMRSYTDNMIEDIIKRKVK